MNRPTIWQGDYDWVAPPVPRAPWWVRLARRIRGGA